MFHFTNESDVIEFFSVVFITNLSVSPCSLAMKFSGGEIDLPVFMDRCDAESARFSSFLRWKS